MAPRSNWTLLLATALSSLVFAGCIGDDQAPASEDDTWAPVLEDVAALLADDAPSANINLLGRLDESGGQEVDAWGDFLFVMKNPRVVIYNISDPSDIQQVGEITLECVKDIKVSDDGKFAFVGCDSPGTVAGPTAGLSTPAASTNGGFIVLDVEDKTAPKEVSFLPVGPRRGPHMVNYHRMADGSELIFGANADISINLFDRATGTIKELARYAPAPVTDWNTNPNVLDAYYTGLAHDMFVMDDPVDNKTLLYVANWDEGLRIVDISDPANPSEVGKWMDYPEGHAGNIHTVATEWVGDRRITVASPEVGFAVVGGTLYAQGTEFTGLYVFDTTDLANIKLLSTWTNPITPHAERGADEPFATMGEKITSSHNVQFENGRVYMAHYDLGVWVIDLSTPELLNAPTTLGYFLEDGMHTWDVVLHGGAMYLGDAKSVFALQFALDHVGIDGTNSRA